MTARDPEAPRRRGTWAPGQSGNPAGRPPGSCNRAGRGLEARLREVAQVDAGAILATLVQAARAGDVAAAAALLGAMAWRPEARVR